MREEGNVEKIEKDLATWGIITYPLGDVGDVSVWKMMVSVKWGG